MLRVENIKFGYGESLVIDDVSFNIERGSHVSIIGESGSGKSTMLKLLFGMYDLQSGHINYNDKEILGPKHNLLPGPESFGYLAQDFGLMPFITSSENVGKFLSNTNKAKKTARINELLSLVEMSDFADINVVNLSGGQQQRIGIAKTLAPEPEVLLLDEPFSQVDVFRSNTLRRNVYDFLKDAGVTCITATHDSDEVLAFSDLVIVMKQGRIVASGKPREIYNDPPDKYVASLFGDVSELPKYLLDGTSENEEKVLCYPHTIRPVEFSGLKAMVDKSYFRGSDYLIEASSLYGKIYFESAVPFESGTGVFLGRRKGRGI